jgi:hypothetical protein
VKLGSKIIGLAIGQKSFLLAEVALKSGRGTVQHFAEFPFPEGLSLATPDQLGQALGQFLKTRKFSTRDVVIGLPAKRLITRRKEVPAAKMEVAAATLRLQAEGEFSSELDSLVLDFAGSPSTVEPTTVLIIATNRQIVDQCTAMAKAANLKVLGITATSAALGRATSRLPGGDGLVLNLGQNGAELVIQHGADPAHLRHLNATDADSPEAISALAGEIRRMMASIPRNGTPMTLALWRGTGGTSENGELNPGNLLEQRLSMPVTTPDIRKLVASDTAAEGFAPAVAVALSAIEPAGLPVDFLHSRLAPPEGPKISLGKKLAIAGGVLAVLLIGGAYTHLTIKQSELDRLNNQIAANSAAVKQATLDAKRLADAKAWIPQGPHLINVLRDITQLFPPQANTIWVTGLNNIKDMNTWEIDGKSVNHDEPYNLVNAMFKSDRFANPLVMNDVVEPTSGLFAFKIRFTSIESLTPERSSRGPQ